MKKHLSCTKKLSLTIAFLFCSTPALLFAYTMSEYFPLLPGSSWSYGRTFFLVSNETQDFSGKFGKHFLDARNYNDILYLHDSDGTVSIIGLKEGDSSIVDISDTPGVLFSAEMGVGDNVESVIPAGKVGPNAITISSTLVAVEPTLTVPAGTFINTLKVKIIIDEVSYSYTEYLWLARNIGPVKIMRGSNVSHDGACLFTCGSFDFDQEIVETLLTQLTSYFQPDLEDADGDGVINALDNCANTPNSVFVDSNGCPGQPKVVVIPLGS